MVAYKHKDNDPPMAKMSTAEKIAFYKTQIAKLEAAEAADAIRDNIKEGDEVTFNFGRGETRTTLAGKVVGVKDDKNGRWVAILAGDGFDQQTYRVRTTDITSAPDAAPVPASEIAVGNEAGVVQANIPADPLEETASTTPEVDPLDPLAQD